jgi:hypothetical protein
MSLNKFTNFDRSSQANMNIQAESLKTEAFIFKPSGVTDLAGKVLEIEDNTGNVIAVDSAFNKNTYNQKTAPPDTYSINSGTTTFTRILRDIDISFSNFTDSTVIKIEVHGDYLTNVPNPEYEPVRFVLSGPIGDLWNYTYVVNPNNNGGMEIPASNTTTPTQKSAFRHEFYLIFNGFGGNGNITTYGQTNMYATSTLTPTDIPKRYTAISNLPIIEHTNVMSLLPSDGVKFRIDTTNESLGNYSFNNHLVNTNILLNS